MRRAGRKPGDVRRKLLQAVCAGASGTLHALLANAGLPADDVPKARSVLCNLCREGVVERIGVVHAPGRAGRPRAIYGPREAANDGPFDVLSFARQAWR